MSDLKGTFVSVLIVGGIIVLVWSSIFLLFLLRD